MRAAAAPGTDAPALPPLFRHHVRRPRLTRLLDASAARIIVLNAPAGYGKTTLAAEWLQGRPLSEVAWYYASAASADVAALSVGIAESVSHILPAGDRVRQRLRVPQVPDNAADILAELLAGDLMKWPETAWLVVDDYHHAMDSKSAERFVEELVRLAPIRMLITTRRRPTWLTARRIVYGEVQEVTMHQLAMTRQEVAAVLDKTATSEAEQAIRTETWPALVGLAALAGSTSRGSVDIERDVFQYLADELLQSENGPSQRFLLTAAVAPYLDASITALLPVAVSPSVMSSLVEKGLFRRDPLDRLSFHPLLREFLRRQIRASEPELAITVGTKIFDHLIAASDWDGALLVASEMAEPDLLTSAFEQAGPELLRSGRVDTLERFSSLIPAELRSRPEIALIRAELALRKGRFRECGTLSLHVADLSPAGSSRTARAWVLHGRARHLQSEHASALEAYERANADTIDADVRAEIVWGRFIVASEIGLADLNKRLVEFAALPGTDPNRRLRIAVGTALVSFYSGRQAAARRAMLESLSLIDLADDPMAISHALSLSTAASVANADYIEGLSRASRATAYCESLRLDFALSYSLAYRGGAEIGLRRLDCARSSLNEIESQASIEDDPHLWLLRSILMIKLQLAEGALEAALRFCPTAELADLSDLPPQQAGELLALEALVHAANGDTEVSQSKAQRAKALTDDLTAAIYSEFVSLTNIAQSSNDTEAVGRALAEGVNWSRRCGQLDIFVTAYRAYPALLTLLPEDSRILAIARRAIRAARDEALVTRLGSAKLAVFFQQEAYLNLTPREIEVVSLIAQGYSNAEIGVRLYIAQSTVKVHVRHILRKLEATTRLEAALRWRDFVETS